VRWRLGAALPLPEGECWLPAGCYFVEARAGSDRQLFPVTLEAAAGGPEDGSAWTVTVRRLGAEPPPRLDEGVPPFVFIPGGYFQPELSSDDLGFRVAALLGAGEGPESGGRGSPSRR
jgi:hypothetical protein